MQCSADFSKAISIIENLDEPWGIKDIESRHVYLNLAAKRYTNTPQKFSVEGKLDIEFPAAWHELYLDLITHDQDTISSNKSVRVLEIHCWNGNDNPVAYISTKTPIYDDVNKCMGILWDAKPAYSTNPILKSLNKSNYQISSEGNNLVTEKELEVTWLLTQGYSRKEISRIYNIPIRTVYSRIHSVFKRLDIHNIAQLREIYVEYGIDNYIPTAILKKGIYNL
ncbi:LuxR C-terminal-related transcriptional regulator [Symbiopectobacterium purcellii]|uniref:LuxR C-terminal-related transcriptional regulator n=1 Tax=Symbiopectobacterium purcellii TaxID=2871826 RepID=UPI003F846127